MELNRSTRPLTMNRIRMPSSLPSHRNRKSWLSVFGSGELGTSVNSERRRSREIRFKSIGGFRFMEKTRRGYASLSKTDLNMGESELRFFRISSGGSNIAFGSKWVGLSESELDLAVSLTGRIQQVH
jgi:hypothetical protein